MQQQHGARSSAAPTSTTAPTRRRSGRPAAPARPAPRPRPPRRWSSRPTPTPTAATCRPRRWSSGSSSARPPTWARPPTTRAPAWSTRSRPSSSPSPSTATARRAARCWSSKTGLSATVNAGQAAIASVAVTNEGTGSADGHPDAVRPPDDAVRRHRHRSPSALRRRPTSTARGTPITIALHHFTVPAGAGNLNGNITWNAQNIGGVAFETLFDPQGNVAAYSLLGPNQSGFGHVEVHNPDPGHLDRGDLHGQQCPVLRGRSSSPTRPSNSTRRARYRRQPARWQPGQTAHVRGEGHRRPGGRRGAQACTWAPAAATTGASRSSSARSSRSARAAGSFSGSADRRRRHRQRRPGVHLPVQRAGGTSRH